MSTQLRRLASELETVAELHTPHNYTQKDQLYQAASLLRQIATAQEAKQEESWTMDPRD